MANSVPSAILSFQGTSPASGIIIWEWNPPINSISITGYRVYSGTNELMADNLPGYQFIEAGLNPNILHTRYVKAFNNYGESEPSLLASLFTLDNNSTDLPIELPRLDKEINGETIPVFQSGIGDNLHLFTKKNKNQIGYEYFDYDLQVKGYLGDIPWYSVKTNSTLTKSIEGTDALKFQSKVINPLKDPTFINGTSDFKLIINSHNPNVLIKSDSIINWSDTTSQYLSIILTAQIIDFKQTSWHPLIHNGYYYFNQKEHYLFADELGKGILTEKEEIQYLDVLTKISARYTQHVPDQELYLLDINKDNFIGSFTNTRIVNDNIVLTDNSIDGSYISEGKKFKKPIDNWGMITWSHIQDSNADLTISLKIDNGDWTPVVSGANISATPLQTVFYKADLKAGQKDVYSDNTITEMDFSGMDSASFNVKADQESISILNPDETIVPIITNITLLEGQSVYFSRIIDMGEKAFSPGKIRISTLEVNQTPVIDIYTMTCDDQNGPWDGSADIWTKATQDSINDPGQRIYDLTSVVKRYLKYALIITRYPIPNKTIISDNNNLMEINGTYTNTTYSQNKGIHLLDTNLSGVFISDIKVITNNTEWKYLEFLTAELPKNGTVAIKTITAASISILNTLEVDELNWLLVEGNQIKSILYDKTYLKYKILIEPGLGTETNVFITDGFLQGIGSVSENITVSPNKISLTDPSIPGYFYSRIINPATESILKEYIETTDITANSSGNIVLELETSDDKIEWNTNLNGNFIRYEVILTPEITVETLTTAINTIAATSKNITAGDSITLIEKFEPGVFISKAIELPKNLINLKKVITNISSLSKENLVTTSISTSSTSNGPWTAWEIIIPDQEIISPNNKYLRYKLEIKSAITLVNKPVVTTSNGSGTVQDIVITNNALTLKNISKSGTYTSEIIDLGITPARMGSIDIKGLNNLSGTALLTETRSAVSTDFTKSVWISSDQGIKSEPNRYIQYRLSIIPQKMPVKQEIIDHHTNDQFTDNTDSADNIKITDSCLRIINKKLPGRYISKPVSTKGLIKEWTNINYVGRITNKLFSPYKVWPIESDEEDFVRFSIQTSNDPNVWAEPWYEIVNKDLPLGCDMTKKYLRYEFILRSIEVNNIEAINISMSTVKILEGV